jgi:hypothetical protein
MRPEIVVPNVEGKHNLGLIESISRLEKAGTYQDLSTVMLCPTQTEMIHCKVIQAWMSLMKPMNQMIAGPVFLTGMEVGAAYDQGFDMVLSGKFSKGWSNTSKWQYILTMEYDNLPPPDGLMKLLESINGGVDGKTYDVMGSLYWTKGETGQPMIYGDPNVLPINFIPQMPKLDAVQPCNGLGMGFTLFRTSMFDDGAIGKPIFKTLSRYQPGGGVQVFTQDLYMFDRCVAVGKKIACDTRVKVGHLDADSGMVW